MNIKDYLKSALVLKHTLAHHVLTKYKYEQSHGQSIPTEDTVTEQDTSKTSSPIRGLVSDQRSVVLGGRKDDPGGHIPESGLNGAEGRGGHTPRIPVGGDYRFPH